MQTVLIQKNPMPEEGYTSPFTATDITFLFIAFLLGALFTDLLDRRRLKKIVREQAASDPCKGCQKTAETLPDINTLTVITEVEGNEDPQPSTVPAIMRNQKCKKQIEFAVLPTPGVSIAPADISCEGSVPAKLPDAPELTKENQPGQQDPRVVEVEENATFVECSWVNPPKANKDAFPLQLPRFEGNSRTPLAQQQFIVSNLTVLEKLLMEGKTSSFIMRNFNVNWIPLAEVLVAHTLPTPQDIKNRYGRNKKTGITLTELYALGEEVSRRSPFRYARSTPSAKLDYIAVISMLKRGMTVPDIAEHIGCPAWKVYGFMEKNKIPTPTALRKGRKQIRLTKKKKEQLNNGQQPNTKEK